MASKKQETKALENTKATLEALVAIAHQCGVSETEIGTVWQIYSSALGAEIYGAEIYGEGVPVREAAPPEPGPFDAVIPAMGEIMANLQAEHAERRAEREAAKAARESKKARKK